MASEGGKKRRRKKTGRPKIPLTRERRQLVLGCARRGLNQSITADLIGVSLSTLERWLTRPDFRKEYDRARLSIKAEIAQGLMDLVRQGNVAATIFACKTQLQWRERGPDVKVEHTTKEAPLQIEFVDTGSTDG